MDGSQDRVEVAGLSVDATLHDFVELEALPGSGVESERFWAGLRALVDEFGPLIRAALDVRERMQSAIDRFHRDRPGPVDPVAYEQHLRAIGYLVPEPEDFRIGTDGVDPEIASIAGPQLVVPVMNARFATNAANARWGSLYDALYGTDVIDEREGRERSGPYNPVRGAEVVRRAKSILDDHVPLESGSHHDVTDYRVERGRLVARLTEGTTGLRDPGQLVGHNRGAVVLRHHGLHLALMVDREHPIGATDPAGLSDVRLEAAVTTIMDLEDSVAAVDAADKVVGYRHWLRLMQGTLSERVTKGGRTFLREMSPDWTITGPDGEDVVLPGRAVLFVRHVGHLMTTDAVSGPDGEPVSEGLLDALVTALAARHDLIGNTVRRNSRTGSMYAVKPKQHGPAEVALTCELFAAVEQILDLPEATIKVGLMDEERRTSVNLKACIHAARERVAFINTGFLDRTGDEIHTSFLAGPMVRKGEMRRQPWIAAYERSNVEVGLACGLGGRAQIGKGMWAAPDNLAEMMEQKIGHPTAGASCAWVPSPTAATLHALHYHRVDVAERQRELGRERGDHLADLLTLPIADASGLTAREREDEIDNNLQGVLGYVVRWVDAGVGCSKVPDITGTPLMEDRATCRISSQHVANWIEHGVVTTEQVEEHLRRMATVVDGQNADDPAYVPMAPSFDGEAFRAARDLVLEGARQPSGYTEPLLHAHRLARKGETGPAPTVPREG